MKQKDNGMGAGISDRASESKPEQLENAQPNQMLNSNLTAKLNPGSKISGVFIRQ